MAIVDTPDHNSAESTDKAVYFSCRCPNCGNYLEYEKSEQSVRCNCCDSMVAVQQVSRASAAGSIAPSPVAEQVLLHNVDSALSALIYLKHYFDTYDWSEYQQTVDLAPYGISEMVERVTIRFATSPETWELAFYSKAIPLTKKIEGCVALADEMGREFDVEDYSAIYPLFDRYVAIVNTLYAGKDRAVSELVSDISMAKKQGLAEDSLATMQDTLDSLQKQFDAHIHPIASLYEIPAVATAIRAAQEAIITALSVKGINAETQYARAVQMQENGGDRGEILSLFTPLRGYADVNGRIDDINRFHNYRDEFFRYAGCDFILREDTATFQVSKGVGDDTGVTSRSAYAVVNGIVSSTPIIEGISRFLTGYGNYLFYIKRGMSVCCTNMQTGEETEIYHGKPFDFLPPEEETDAPLFFLNRDKTVLFLRRRLRAYKKGCRDIFRGTAATKLRQNNYTVIACDMVSRKASSIIPAVVDIVGVYHDNLFYRVSDEAEKEPQVSLELYHIPTGTVHSVLNSCASIHKVMGDHVIYTLASPNKKNRELHILDISTGKDQLLERNIYRYMETVGDRVFYTVGSDYYSPLFSIKFDGTERSQIAIGVSSILFTRGEWLYALKGESNSRNIALMKFDLSGGKQQVICTQFRRLVKETSDRIYYLDNAYTLHSVRIDGKENRIIAARLQNEFCFVEREYVFYTQTEPTGKKDKFVHSLYRTDLQGRNLKKIVYRIRGVAEWDADHLFYAAYEGATYRVKHRLKKMVSERREHYRLLHYCALGKATGDSHPVLTLGEPKNSTQRGPLGTVQESYEYEKLPYKVEDETRGLTRAGAVHKKQLGITANADSGSKRWLFPILIAVLMLVAGFLMMRVLADGEYFRPISFLCFGIALAVGLFVLWANVETLPPHARGKAVRRAPTKYQIVISILLVIAILLYLTIGVINLVGAGKTDKFDRATSLSLGSKEYALKKTDRYFSFRPTTDATYTFTTSGSLDTYAVLYNREYEKLTSDDDSGTDKNFSISYRLSAGKTYYLTVKADDDDKVVLSVSQGASAISGTSFSTAKTIGTGVTTVTLNSATPTMYFRFTPTSSKSYRIYSTGSSDPKVTLYSSSEKILTSDNDSGTNYNFSVSYSFTKGITYYIEVSVSNRASSAAFNLCIE